MLPCRLTIRCARQMSGQVFASTIRPSRRSKGLCKVAIFDSSNWGAQAIHPPTSETNKRLNSLSTDDGRDGLTETLVKLKALGLKIAICTTDDRRTTEKRIKELHLFNVVDVMKCADDLSLLPKPHPSNIDSICADAGVRPENVVLIGDTETDMKLARNANVGFTIGVTSLGTHTTLGALSDELVYSIKEIIPVIQRENEIMQEKEKAKNDSTTLDKPEDRTSAINAT